MKFGIFYERQLPRPWDPDAEYRVLQEALEQCALADRLGIDYVWAVEHHFLEEYSHSSAPEVFLAAVSQRTARIRLGHGIDQLIFASQAGRNRHEDVMESLELFGREVLPDFREREERRAPERAERLAPVIERVLARKPASDHPPAPGPRPRDPGHSALRRRSRGVREVPPPSGRPRRPDGGGRGRPPAAREARVR
jgi:hypothetical protein